MLYFRPDPKNDHGTYHRRTYLSQRTGPRNADPAQHVTTYESAYKAQQQVNKAALLLMSHNLAGDDASQNTYDNSPNHVYLF